MQEEISIPGLSPYTSFKSVFGTQVPRILYHYTSAAGLHGILSSKEIWASNIHYLNDAKELSLALELFSSTLDRLIAQDNLSDETVLLQKLKDAITSIADINIFTCSFSKVDDVLSQWRAYCPEGGYSLGFEAALLKKRAITQNFMLAPCVYDQSEQKKLVQELIDEHLQLYRKNMETGATHKLPLLSLLECRFRCSVFYIAPLFKHYTFHEEAEWRLFSSPTADFEETVGHRPIRSKLIPYRKFALDENGGSQLISVKVGPMPHPELAMKSVRGFLTNERINGVNITPSATPYRVW